MAQVLFINSPEALPLPPQHTIFSILDKDEAIVVSSWSAAWEVLQRNKISILVFNHPHHEYLKRFRDMYQGLITILVTSLPMASYAALLQYNEPILLDHIIAHRVIGYWTTQELRVTLKKILEPTDILGIEKYLSPSTAINRMDVTCSADRETFNNEVLNFVLKCKLGQHMAKVCFGISEELMMNALHDAPLAANIPYYLELERTAPVTLRPEDFARLSFGCDGRLLAIGILDPFGALKKERLFAYLQKVLKRQDPHQIIDTKVGGAGLGFFKILYSCHGLVCNVIEGKSTEVIALIDVGEPIRDFAHLTRSIHYFYGKHQQKEGSHETPIGRDPLKQDNKAG